MPPRTWAAHVDSNGAQIPGTSASKTGNQISECLGISAIAAEQGVTLFALLLLSALFLFPPLLLLLLPCLFLGLLTSLLLSLLPFLVFLLFPLPGLFLLLSLLALLLVLARFRLLLLDARLSLVLLLLALVFQAFAQRGVLRVFIHLFLASSFFLAALVLLLVALILQPLFVLLLRAEGIVLAPSNARRGDRQDGGAERK